MESGRRLTGESLPPEVALVMDYVADAETTRPSPWV